MVERREAHRGNGQLSVRGYRYCISGSMTVKMDSGEEFTVSPGDAFHMPPGHYAWTEGKEACVLIDVTGVKNYAKPA